MKIQFLKPHEHDGQQYEPGGHADVPHSIATFLIERGIAEAIKTQPKPKPTETPQ